MPDSIWPNNAQAAISFTCDNLGEAQEINSGTWPSDIPPGNHWSVREVLPKILQTYEDYDVKATFFFESWSVGLYRTVTEDIVRRGHEIAWHGWQHEPWTKLSADDERDNFHKSFAQAEKLGLEYVGFRPPGGLINDQTSDLLQDHGVRYISPAAERVAIDDGLAILPFQWQTVDALYYMDQFSKLRQKYGVAEGTEACIQSLLDLIDKAVASNGYISILFHPILQDSPEKLAVIEKIVHRVSKDPRIWCAPCNEVADWVLQHRGTFSSDPGWIKASW